MKQKPRMSWSDERIRQEHSTAALGVQIPGSGWPAGQRSRGARLREGDGALPGALHPRLGGDRGGPAAPGSAQCCPRQATGACCSVAAASPPCRGQTTLFQVRLRVLLRVCLSEERADAERRPGRARGGERRDASETGYLLVCADKLRGPRHRDFAVRSGSEHGVQRGAGVRGQFGHPRKLQFGQLHQAGGSLSRGSVLLWL